MMKRQSHVIRRPVNSAENTYSRDRTELMNSIFTLSRRNERWIDDIEDILLRHNANPDDSDPVEGYCNTMSDEDLQLAYDEILELVTVRNIEDRLDPDSLPDRLDGYMYSALMLAQSDTLVSEAGKDWCYELYNKLTDLNKFIRERGWSD